MPLHECFQDTMGEGCLAGPGKRRHNIGSVELFIAACPEARLVSNETRASVRRPRQPLEGRRGKAAADGLVAEVVVANPSEDHEQAVTSDWRARAQPDTPFARRIAR